jgi:hypothetical protein
MTAMAVAEVAAAAAAMATEAEAEAAVRCGGWRGWRGWVGAATAAHWNRCRWYESMKTRGQKFCLWTYVCTMTKNNGVQYYDKNGV